MKRTVFVIVLFFLAVCMIFAQKKESLAVFSFTGGEASDGEAIASSLTRQAVLRNAFNRTTLITRNTIATMNFEQRFQRNSGLTDADTIFELGRQLNASHVIAGYIAKLGDQNLIIISIMDIESLQQIAGDYRTYRTIEDIDSLIPSIAQKLAAAVPRNTNNLPGLSVPPFNISRDVNQNDAMVLAQILACDLANGNKFAVLPRTDSIEKVMEEHQRQRDGTTDQDRIKRLGIGRNAQFVLSGSVQKLGTLNKFTADILDILDGSFIDGHEENYNVIGDGLAKMAVLSGKLTGASVPVVNRPTATTTTSAATTVPTTSTTASTPVAVSNAVISANAGWKIGVDNRSTSRINFTRETIDGRVRDVLTIDVNVASGDSRWAGAFLDNRDIQLVLRRSSGVRFKVLGDGKNWGFYIATSDVSDSGFHAATISTRNGRITEIDIPYTRLRQPDWGRKVPFNKQNIIDFSIHRSNSHGAGTSTIKIFDFEIY